MLIQKIGAVAHANGIKAILHGPAGSGKTYTISTIPEPETVLVLSAEAGLLSIREKAASVDVTIISSVDDLRAAYDYLSSPSGDKYKTVVLDSLTEIADQVLAAAFTSKNGKDVDGRQAYGEVKDVVSAIVRKFRDLIGKNVILICQQEKIQDDLKRILHVPAMPGKKLGQSLPYQVDLMGCMRQRINADGKTERAIQFAESADILFAAKDRSGVLDEFEPADWSVIFRKINSKN